MKDIFILGAAGSIGQQTLDVISAHIDQFRVVGYSLGKNKDVNQMILDHYPVEICCLRDSSEITEYQKRYPRVQFVFGDQGLIEVAQYPKKGILINALSGSSGLLPTVKAIMSGKDIALANKETLVMAGEIITSLVEKYNVRLLPIDSEHSAIWQLLEHEDINQIDTITITASGGSLRDYPREALKNVTVEEALKHPNWKMGAKITIDSATMMNKGLEVIEAHHLFGLPFDRIKTILHYESWVHGMITYKDGTIKASIGPSDMRIPIYYALAYPKRDDNKKTVHLDQLTFSPMDFERYPLLRLAYHVGQEGGLLPTVMNAANEAAVKLFLANKISYLQIEQIVIETINAFNNVDKIDLEMIINTDKRIQKSILDAYGYER